MRKVAVAFGAAAAAFGLSAPAQAATIMFNITAPSGTFEANPISCDAGPAGCAGTFTASGSFAAPIGYHLVQASLDTNAISPATNIDFSSAILNGMPFTLTPNGIFEFGTLTPIMLQPVNNLVVTGYTGGAASFAGNLTFAAVPEPATWALMLLGFGAIGMMIRRRRSTEVTARLQMA